LLKTKRIFSFLAEGVLLQPIFSVSEATQIIKNLIDSNEILQNIYIRGEISNFKHHLSGHMYFTLKDEKSQIRCVMFRQSNILLSFKPENGMKVIAFGNISVFEKNGEYQLYVNSLEPDGIGGLYVAFEKLKERLAQEGLFDPYRKKPIPFLPKKIGIVTSITGAAIKDLITVITRRYPNINIVIAPVLVQGKDAAKEISNAIRDLNRISDIDVIIVGRGGGSIEELWAFNEEDVARAIADSHIPVISAVGHETDFTIADFVSDKRAATPSAAGEMVVPEKSRLENDIRLLKIRLLNSVLAIINLKRQQLEYYRKSSALTKPKYFTANSRIVLDQLTKNLLKNVSLKINNQRITFKHNISRLNAVNPLAILDRGYSICQRIENGKIVRTIYDTFVGDSMEVILSDGRLRCKVIDRKEKGD